MRTLGRSGIVASDIGLGTWALGGPYSEHGQPCGWGPTDDAEARRTIRAAVDAGISLIDTADVYGAGHAEELIGQTLAGHRGEVVISTKWGSIFSEDSKVVMGARASAEQLRSSLEASLRRLRTDYVDVLHIHVNDLPTSQALSLVDELDELVHQGLIRTYGWSTDFLDRAEHFAASSNASVIQHEMNVLRDSPPFVELTEKWNLGALCRAPLAMGLLTDKVGDGSRVSAEDDIRQRHLDWMQWFSHGHPDPDELARRDSVARLLRDGGRTLAQGSLAWVLARSARALPLAGMRHREHVAENVRVLDQGPLSADVMAEIERILRSDSVHGGSGP